jgi:methionyl-tRNA formyltransferase
MDFPETKAGHESKPYRVIFMGTPAFAVPSLLTLLNDPKSFEVVLVVSQPDRRAGRGRKVAMSEVKVAALEHGLDMFQPKTMRDEESYERLAALKSDLFVVAAYGQILPQNILDLPLLGAFNVHASLLPAYRGASPIAHMILAGESEAGVTLMGMEAGLDTGPIYCSDSIGLKGRERTSDLTLSLASLGAELLAKHLGDIATGRLPGTKQDNHASSYARLLKKEQGRLDFRRSAETLERQIRAFYPWPSCFTFLKGKRVQFLEARIVDAQGQAGQILSADKEGFVVACGIGSLWVTEVKAAGKANMSGGAWFGGIRREGELFFELEPL